MMMQSIRRSFAPLALSLVFAAGACAGGDDNDDALATDTSLNRDLELANADSAAQPALTDVPATSTTTPSTSRPSTSGSTARPSTSTKTSTPTTTKTSSGNTVTRNPSSGTSGSTGGGGVGTVAAGTALSLANGARVCTNTNKVGDIITATVNETVTGSNGAAIPAGSTVRLRITSLKRSENMNDNVVIGLEPLSVSVRGTSYTLAANVTSAQVEKVRSTTKSSDAKKVIGGAVLGGIIGQATGKDTKSTVIGAAAGAAAGTAAAAATANYEGCINAGDTIRLSLTSGLQVRA
jgi:hypothetical protein